MRLRRGGEGVRHPHVQLLGAEREPGAAGHAQGRRLLELPEAEQLTVEAPRLRLAARWRRDLHVIEAGDHAAEASGEPSSSITRASSWPARYAPTSRASSSSAAGTQPPSPAGRPPPTPPRLRPSGSP